MKNIIMGIIVGIVLGIGLLYSGLYIQGLNARVTGIEKFLQQAISQSQQAQPQRPVPVPSK